MKSATKQATAKLGRSAISRKTQKSLSSPSFAITKEGSTNLQMHSQLPIDASRKLQTEQPQQYLSKSLEKIFLRMKNDPTERDAYLLAEIPTFLAHQIRAIRIQRGWSQSELARLLGTTQTAVSPVMGNSAFITSSLVTKQEGESA